jgi:serine/threonine protein kinase
MSHQEETTPSTLLELVLAEYARRADDGIAQDREAFVAEFVEKLRACLAASDQLDDVATGDASPSKAFQNTPTLVPLDVDRSTAPSVIADDNPSTHLPRDAGVLSFGDYELLEEIARGGMGVVYKARQLRPNRIVALKMILAGQLASPTDVKRFHAEAEAAANLDHPGIVPVFEVGVRDGQHYFSMGYVEGQSLAEKLSQGPLPPREAAEILLRVAEAVEYAHRHGVIHRDLKPANILLQKSDVRTREQGAGSAAKPSASNPQSAIRNPQLSLNPKVTDFGLARRIEGDSQLTGSGQILGTPSFMPPEQAAAKQDQIGPMCDVYSMGAILYAMVTGRPPFQSASPMETLLEVLEREPVAPRLLNAKLPRDLNTICLKCLRKEPSKRYHSAAALADDLGRWLENKPIVARPVGRGERIWLWCKRRPAVAALSAAMLAISTVGTLVAVERQTAVRADGLVKSLLNANVEQVPQLIAELENYRRWATPALLAIAESPTTSPDDRRRQLHARLALVAHDPRHVPVLLEELLTGNFAYAGALRDRLAPYQDQIQEALWTTLHDNASDTNRRFRAGAALAGYSARSEQWSAADYEFLAAQLVRANPEQQRLWRDLLRPEGERMLSDLERIFQEQTAAENHRLGAASALADFAANDVVRLTQLLSIANSDQFNIVYPLVADVRDPAARQLLNSLAREAPAPELSQVEGIRFGQRRAQAGIALVRLGEREEGLRALRFQDDPESLTQFIHGCRERGILVFDLLECVRTIDSTRHAKSGPERQLEDRVLFGLLLSLGEYDLKDLPENERDRFVRQLADWYANDSSSAIHGASGWLLRHWNEVELANRVDQTPVAYAEAREWYTLQFKIPTNDEQSFCLTFIVFPPGEYLVGPAAGEPDSRANQQRHRVTLTRAFALSDREITWARFDGFDGHHHHDAWARQFQRVLPPDGPAFGVNWFTAVGYCRWLTMQAHLQESDQCYADPTLLAKDGAGNPTDWPLDVKRDGFRVVGYFEIVATKTAGRWLFSALCPPIAWRSHVKSDRMPAWQSRRTIRHTMSSRWTGRCRAKRSSMRCRTFATTSGTCWLSSPWVCYRRLSKASSTAGTGKDGGPK